MMQTLSICTRHWHTNKQSSQQTVWVQFSQNLWILYNIYTYSHEGTVGGVCAFVVYKEVVTLVQFIWEPLQVTITFSVPGHTGAEVLMLEKIVLFLRSNTGILPMDFTMVRNVSHIKTGLK